MQVHSGSWRYDIHVERVFLWFDHIVFYRFIMFYLLIVFYLSSIAISCCPQIAKHRVVVVPVVFLSRCSQTNRFDVPCSKVPVQPGSVPAVF